MLAGVRAPAWLRVVLGIAMLLGCRPRSAPALDEPVSSRIEERGVSVLDPEGRLLVRSATTQAGQASYAVRDVASGELLGEFTGHAESKRYTRSLALTRSGSLVASLRGQGDEILVWDLRTRELVSRIRTDAWVVGYTFDRDERSLMIATERGLERRALQDGRIVAAWPIVGVRAFAAVPGRAAWLLAVQRRSKKKWARPIVAEFLLLDERRPRPRRLRIPGVFGVVGLRISPDGRMLAVAAWGLDAHHLQVWNLRTRRRILVNDWGHVNAMEFSADSRTLVASLGFRCTHDARVTAWNLGTARPAFEVRAAQASSIRIVGDEARVVIGDDVLGVDLATGRTRDIYKTPCEGICNVMICS